MWLQNQKLNILRLLLEIDSNSERFDRVIEARVMEMLSPVSKEFNEDFNRQFITDILIAIQKNEREIPECVDAIIKRMKDA